jgi:hypothetical protein
MSDHYVLVFSGLGDLEESQDYVCHIGSQDYVNWIRGFSGLCSLRIIGIDSCVCP